jgi:beta-mannanase
MTETGPARNVHGASPSSRVYLGVHVPGWLQDLSLVTAFEAHVQKAVSIVMWYQGWGLTDGSQYFEASWMDAVRNHGSIPLVTWEPWLYTQGVNQSTYSLSNIINGHLDAYITRWAQDSHSWGYPYFLRFAHEMNGNWYPWSEQVNGNKPGQYMLAWKHVHDIFKAQGASNVTWVWSPNVEYPGSIALKELYPGDGYVDWVGMDGYNWGTVYNHRWQSFSQVFQQTYDDILKITSRPLMVAETGSTEQSGIKANWITDAFAEQIPNKFPKIKAVVWFNESKETDWRIESSPAAQAAFARAVASSVYATNQCGALSASPITVLE